MEDGGSWVCHFGQGIYREVNIYTRIVVRWENSIDSCLAD